MADPYGQVPNLRESIYLPRKGSVSAEFRPNKLGGQYPSCRVILIFPVTCRITEYTYLLTPWSRVLLEKLTGSEASQEIPRIFGTRRFITVLTSARHISLS